MRRPLPPELIMLGDHLEGAVRRAVGRRRTRRQLALNAVASLLVALPMVPAVVNSAATPVVVAPVRLEQPDKRSFGGAENDFPPRVLRRADRAAADLLAEPSTLRRALR